ncbi:hypothetical protein SELMODRAFT_414701 [Selaginella moellendorffii]|uniref:Uncharacterized protein n=1 Tax=Selaginella moellendorffii TaxID=88036 RepID=D8RTM6_SELML|nr:hypothetical protein SELMODRAFT_414701 [Selaginella moellendorffii]
MAPAGGGGSPPNHGVSKGSGRGGTAAQQRQGQGIAWQCCIPFSSRRSTMAMSSCNGMARGIDREAAARDLLERMASKGMAQPGGFGVTLPSKQASDGLVDMAAKLAEGVSRMDRCFMVMEIRWQSLRLRYVLGSVKLEKKKSGNPHDGMILHSSSQI